MGFGDRIKNACQKVGNGIQNATEKIGDVAKKAADFAVDYSPFGTALKGALDGDFVGGLKGAVKMVVENSPIGSAVSMVKAFQDGDFKSAFTQLAVMAASCVPVGAAAAGAARAVGTAAKAAAKHADEVADAGQGAKKAANGPTDNVAGAVEDSRSAGGRIQENVDRGVTTYDMATTTNDVLTMLSIQENVGRPVPMYDAATSANDVLAMLSDVTKQPQAQTTVGAAITY